MLAPSIRADRLDDAVSASNFEDVNYLLVMKGNAVSQHRKDELVLLASEMTLTRKRQTYPLHNLHDALTTAKGVFATYVAYKCAQKIASIGMPDLNDELEIVWAVVRYEFFGVTGLACAGYGVYSLIQGLRSAQGRELYAQAQLIEKRINELKVVAEHVV